MLINLCLLFVTVQVSSLLSLLLLCILPANSQGISIPLGREITGGQPAQECALVRVAPEDREDSRSGRQSDSFSSI